MRLPTVLGAALGLIAVAAPQGALADRLIIKEPGNQPTYSTELEPHLVLGGVLPTLNAPDHQGFGLGARASFPVARDGFIGKINDSVAIGVGLDWVHYGNAWQGCVAYHDNGRTCADYERHAISYVWIPVVMQWNFFLSEQWSVFGEPGLALRFMSDEDRYGDTLRLDPFVLYLGGRWHFSDTATLTLRLGSPTFSVGVSFLL